MTETPQKPQFYNKINNKYHCKYKFPELTQYEYAIIELYNSCSMAKDNGMTNYNVLIEVAKSHGFTNFDDLIYLAGCIDNERMKNL